MDYPKGHLIAPASRHLTLAFLGNVSLSKLESLLPEFPRPVFKIGPVGFFDQCLMLPEQHPHVVAWHVQWHEAALFNEFQSTLQNWLRDRNYPIDKRPLLPHVSIARTPFEKKEWLDSFIPLPLVAQSIHLYESMGDLVYRPVWSYPLLSPFVELSHTADIAFLIQAESPSGIHLHAQTALAFKFPSLLRYLDQNPLKTDLNDIVISLNSLITRCDSEIGCPIKAVSFHGDMREQEGIFTWEMIIDV